MLPEAGHFLLLLAFAAALLCAAVPMLGAHRGYLSWQHAARPLAIAQLALVVGSFACLAWSFLEDDFSVALVALHGSVALPAVYKFSAVWGNHEGSLLLWTMLLCGWTAAVAMAGGALPWRTRAAVVSVMSAVSAGFMSFSLFTSNPFARLLPNTPVAGGELNPLLQDLGLVIHPPLLYMGYVGFAVAFGFAVAALLEGRRSRWAAWVYPWTLGAWSFLTVGIALGSWWAYYELGWGGWWFWDPVENASLMPWLVGTALVHSLMVTMRRGAFGSWSMLLAILAFAMCLLGTFLVRSGVLTSVHAFAADPARGVFILSFLIVAIGGALLLFAWRAPLTAATATRIAPLSREGLLLLNNVVLVACALTVLVGTMFPLVMDALGLGKYSIGPPYFNVTVGPMLLLLIALMLAMPCFRWGGGLVRPRLFQGPVRWGVVFGHGGLFTCALGAMLSTALNQESDVHMAPGDAARLGAHRFEYRALEQHEGPNYQAERALISVSRDGEPVALLRPEKRLYAGDRQMTEAGIDPGFTRDIYVAMGQRVDGQAWGFRLRVKPFVRWIWLGALLMACGGTLAVWTRVRAARRRARALDGAGDSTLLGDARAGG